MNTEQDKTLKTPWLFFLNRKLENMKMDDRISQIC